MKGYLFAITLFLLITGQCFAENQKDPNWRWKDSPSNPKNAAYTLSNTVRPFENSLANPRNSKDKNNLFRINVKIPEVTILGVTIAASEGYAVEQFERGHINVFNDEGTKLIAYCNWTSHMEQSLHQILQAKEERSVSIGIDPDQIHPKVLACREIKKGSEILPTFALNGY